MFLKKITYVITASLLVCNISLASEFISKNPYKDSPNFKSEIHEINLSPSFCKKNIDYENSTVKIKICQELFLDNLKEFIARHNNRIKQDQLLLEYVEEKLKTSNTCLFFGSDEWLKNQYDQIDKNMSLDNIQKAYKDIANLHLQKYGYSVDITERLMFRIADHLEKGNVEIFEKSDGKTHSLIYLEEYDLYVDTLVGERGRFFYLDNGNVFFHTIDASY